MRLSNIILASLMAASLTGLSQNDKPTGCGKTKPKEADNKPVKDHSIKSDTLQKPVIKKPESVCGKCGRG